MQERQEVFFEGRPVGTVELTRDGLYYRLECRCRMPGQEIRRLYADGARIGVMIPEAGELVLKTKVAAKRLKPGCRFSLEENGEEFIPIRPGEPFCRLDKVRMGKLAFREGEPGLFLEKVYGLF